MKDIDLPKVLKQHRMWLDGKGGERADLSWADLSGANLDLSCWPLSCNTLDIRSVDDRLVEQLLFHLDALPMSKEWRKKINRIALRDRRAFAERREDLKKYRVKPVENRTSSEEERP